jgi:phosphoribosylformylglycinamidine synthase
LEIPITGGNVSFYNDTLGKSIEPTPVLGVLGVIEDASRTLGMGFRAEGDAILLLDGRGDSPVAGGEGTREFASSEYAKTIHGIVAGAPPAVELAAEKRLIRLLEALASKGIIGSAHDISDGGLAVALAESCFASDGLSAEAKIGGAEPAEIACFGERGARAIVSAAPARVAEVLALAREYGVRGAEIGRVGRGAFAIEYNGRSVARAPLETLRGSWARAFERALQD